MQEEKQSDNEHQNEQRQNEEVAKKGDETTVESDDLIQSDLEQGQEWT